MAFVPPSAGDLRDRIRLERRQNVDDGYGNLTGRWVTFASDVRAQINPAKGGEVTRADRLVGVSNFDIHVRSSSNTTGLTTGDRAVHERSGEVYDIKWARCLDVDRRWLTLVCSSEATNG